jgi:hypothetical protein
MVVVQMRGRLGNQMFIYAFGLAVAQASGKKIYFDWLGYEEGVSGFIKRLRVSVKKRTRNVLGCAQTVQLEEIFGIKLKRAPWFSMGWVGICRRMLYIRESEVSSFPQLINILKSNKNIYLDGYWQLEDYFSGVEENVRNVFCLSRHLSPGATSLCNLIKQSISVAVHVRRGDYIDNPETAAEHNICGVGFYRQAIDWVKSNVAEPKIFIFSDDIKWCIRNLSDLADDIVFVDYDRKTALPETDIELMMSCTHFIIANSSYSWWAAWLGESKNKIVVAPSLWNLKKPEVHPQCETWKNIEVL